jgi:alkanesulfonate monooxygenase SsuD/methylene tetrahydromethanopterin reductase-like flavin-dependent oxidoreductase (luciferase family)
VSGGGPLGVYLGWHVHGWDDLVRLVERAEALGYEAAFVDGDVSMLGRRSEADCLDGWTVTTALLVRTTRIQVGSLRLVHHWNAARLAQAAATAERIAPGRLRFQIAIGDRAEDARFGLERLPAGDRIVWLDETLDAVRALWRGETVTRSGRFVRLDRARIRPAPGALPITIAARRPRMLAAVARHADLWEINLPPLPDRVSAAAAELARACEAEGRDPGTIGRTMLLHARLGPGPGSELAAFRRLNPWFESISDDEIRPALLVGDAADVRTRIDELRRTLGLTLPVLDLSGFEASAAREVLDALAPSSG